MPSNIIFVSIYAIIISRIFSILSTLSFFFLLFKGPGILCSTQINSEQKVQVFTPQGDKQFHFTDKTNKTAAKILQSSLVIYKRKHLNSIKEDESIKEEKQIEIPSLIQQDNSQLQEKQSKPQPQSVVYLEQLYCISCLIDQILRSRHCVKCGACILAYDHHNFILGKCIGEKNKLIYLITLIFHSIQAILATIYLNHITFVNGQYYIRSENCVHFSFFATLTYLLSLIKYILIGDKIKPQAENRFMNISQVYMEVCLR
ncbi:unnamed protein product (macronuclear) [Paramecium tetraurelia]|uniref:Palmitoyltransferase n=1 Tax=Paramecium tetraurelia TaxID=5888 RepID=A0DLX2_PARTE|nr:uncharacterized protein GSPATT00018257001 [Paramecium tetraurelia]CAK84039.1 unnamed protein product [Paramecium tetraurelia]|eukprot:XP_001451436.1 hypothetical protein (macronuclear) [Paramecium tetraurelia strain d4-2]